MQFYSQICFYFRNNKVMPYEGNRVKLNVPLDGEDFVNASFIKPSTSSSPQFIVAQDPLTSTVTNFLQMVVEQNVKMIIMLSKKGKGITNQFKNKGQYHLNQLVILHKK